MKDPQVSVDTTCYNTVALCSPSSSLSPQSPSMHEYSGIKLTPLQMSQTSQNSSPTCAVTILGIENGSNGNNIDDSGKPRITSNVHTTVAQGLKVPYLVLSIAIIIWSIFLCGKYGSNHETDPPFKNLWYYSVSFWPQCKDERSQVWRLLSYSLIHANFLHVGGNSIFLVGYGLLLESIHLLAIPILFTSYLLGILIGALGHNYWYPYQALIGASAGCYSVFGTLLGATIAFPLLIPNYPAVVITLGLQVMGDILLYFLYRSPQGLCIGIIAFSWIRIGTFQYDDKRKIVQKISIAVAFMGLFLLMLFLFSRYSVFPHKTSEISCCKSAFELDMPMDEVGYKYYCSNDVLYPYVDDWLTDDIHRLQHSYDVSDRLHKILI